MQSDRERLCVLANEDQENPLFILPAAGATPLSLIPLARALQPTRRVCSFEYAGMDASGEPQGELNEIAATCIREIKHAQPAGPYRLAGYCPELTGARNGLAGAGRLANQNSADESHDPVEEARRCGRERDPPDHYTPQRGHTGASTEAHPVAICGQSSSRASTSVCPCRARAAGPRCA